MRRLHTGHYFLILFLTGFLTGVVYANYELGKQAAWSGTFTEAFLRELEVGKIVLKQYFWYLLRARLLLCAIMALLLVIRIRKPAVVLLLLWMGALGGIFLSEAVIQWGMKGSLFCMAGLLPQFLFYVPAVFVYLRYVWNFPQSQWNRQKTIFAGSLLLIGFWTEWYLNSWLVSRLVQLLFSSVG